MTDDVERSQDAEPSGLPRFGRGRSGRQRSEVGSNLVAEAARIRNSPYSLTRNRVPVTSLDEEDADDDDPADAQLARAHRNRYPMKRKRVPGSYEEGTKDDDSADAQLTLRLQAEEYAAAHVHKRPQQHAGFEVPYGSPYNANHDVGRPRHHINNYPNPRPNLFAEDPTYGQQVAAARHAPKMTAPKKETKKAPIEATHTIEDAPAVVRNTESRYGARQGDQIDSSAGSLTYNFPHVDLSLPPPVAGVYPQIDQNPIFRAQPPRLPPRTDAEIRDLQLQCQRHYKLDMESNPVNGYRKDGTERRDRFGLVSQVKITEQELRHVRAGYFHNPGMHTTFKDGSREPKRLTRSERESLKKYRGDERRREYKGKATEGELDQFDLQLYETHLVQSLGSVVCPDFNRFTILAGLTPVNMDVNGRAFRGTRGIPLTVGVAATHPAPILSQPALAPQPTPVAPQTLPAAMHGILESPVPRPTAVSQQPSSVRRGGFSQAPPSLPAAVSQQPSSVRRGDFSQAPLSLPAAISQQPSSVRRGGFSKAPLPASQHSVPSLSNGVSEVCENCRLSLTEIYQAIINAPGPPGASLYWCPHCGYLLDPNPATPPARMQTQRPSGNNVSELLSPSPLASDVKMEDVYD